MQNGMQIHNSYISSPAGYSNCGYLLYVSDVDQLDDFVLLRGSGALKAQEADGEREREKTAF